MAKITRINPEGISKPFSNYSHVVTAEGAQKLAFCAGQVAADSEVVEAARRITKHGKPAVVVVAADEYERLRQLERLKASSFADHLLAMPTDERVGFRADWRCNSESVQLAAASEALDEATDAGAMPMADIRVRPAQAAAAHGRFCALSQVERYRLG